MSIFVAWLVSTIVAVGTTTARFLTGVEFLNRILIPAWFVNVIIFLSMLYSLARRVDKLYKYGDNMFVFVVNLIATIVTLGSVFATFVAKVGIPIWVPTILALITFVIFCYLIYSLFYDIQEAQKAQEEKKRERY